MIKPTILFLLFCITSTYSQTVVQTQFETKEDGLKIIQLELQKQEVITIKDIFVFMDTIIPAQRIEDITKLIKEHNVKQAMFFFIELPKKNQANVQEIGKQVFHALYAIQRRKMLLESKFFIFAAQGYTAYYNMIKQTDADTLKKQGLQKYSGYMIEIKDVFTGQDFEEVKKYILNTL
jgi:hypothetical protein